MPKYNVIINHVYEEIEQVEVEAEDEETAYDLAENLAKPNDAWDHAEHTGMTVLEVEEV